MATERIVVVSMEVDAPAPEVYRRLVELARKRPAPGTTDTSFTEVIADDEERFFFEAKRVGTKGEVLWGAFQVTPVSSRKSHILHSGFGEDWATEDIENKIRANLREFCETGGYNYKIMKVEEEREAI